MKLWSRGRDQLVEQTLALVKGANPNPAGTASPMKSESAKPIELENKLVSERVDIARRVADFRAHQAKLGRERDAYYNSVQNRIRDTLDGPHDPKPLR